MTPELMRAIIAATDEIIALRKQNAELLAILEKIADFHRGPGSALAQSALDTMKALNEPRA